MSKYDPENMTDEKLIEEGNRFQTYEALRRC
jgi:hypothetical protein